MVKANEKPQLEFECPLTQVWSAIAFLGNLGASVTAVSPEFAMSFSSRKLSGATQEALKKGKIWIHRDSAGTFIRTLAEGNQTSPYLMFVGCRDDIPGYRMDLLGDKPTFADVVAYVNDPRFKRRLNFVTAVSPPVPGTKPCVYFCRR
mmetsp:Transcript_3636/g.5432  ORF Transcript_3636/g.5432 Transcript_3636/m.5432 type:complete len:148 (-) Transcript_3636:729-1172(-)